jgi:hypothetical protein
LRAVHDEWVYSIDDRAEAAKISGDAADRIEALEKAMREIDETCHIEQQFGRKAAKDFSHDIQAIARAALKEGDTNAPG